MKYRDHTEILPLLEGTGHRLCCNGWYTATMKGVHSSPC